MRCFSIFMLAATAALASAQPRLRAQTAVSSLGQGESIPSVPTTKPTDGNTNGILGDDPYGLHSVPLKGGILGDDPYGLHSVPLKGAASAPSPTTQTPTLGDSVVSGRGTRTPAPTSPTPTTKPPPTTEPPTLGDSVVSGRGTRTPAPTSPTSTKAAIASQGNSPTRGSHPRGITLNGGIMSEPLGGVTSEPMGTPVATNGQAVVSTNGLLTKEDLPPSPAQTTLSA